MGKEKIEMRKSLLFAGLLLAANPALSAMPPAENYCEHMGYNYTHVENGSQSESICRFSETASCPAGEFLNGECGQEHVKEISCREEGEPVFTEFESCCGDMEPYVQPGAIGQATCQPEKSLLQKLSGNLNFLFQAVADIILG
jgi:putative hemolysin